jgi:hypothetical protein
MDILQNTKAHLNSANGNVQAARNEYERGKKKKKKGLLGIKIQFLFSLLNNCRLPIDFLCSACLTLSSARLIGQFKPLNSATISSIIGILIPSKPFFFFFFRLSYSFLTNTSPLLIEDWKNQYQSKANYPTMQEVLNLRYNNKQPRLSSKVNKSKTQWTFYKTLKHILIWLMEMYFLQFR